MPWSSRTRYGALESGEDEQCQKDTHDDLSAIIAIFIGFFVWLIGVALLSMILVILLDVEYMSP